MTKRLTICPRYTDYTSGVKAKEAFLSGADFTGLAMGSYDLAVNLEDCQREGITDVTIRYRKSTQITTCEVPPMSDELRSLIEQDVGGRLLRENRIASKVAGQPVASQCPE
jgi:hypothetical protein